LVKLYPDPQLTRRSICSTEWEGLGRSTDSLIILELVNCEQVTTRPETNTGTHAVAAQRDIIDPIKPRYRGTQVSLCRKITNRFSRIPRSNPLMILKTSRSTLSKDSIIFDKSK